MCKNGHFGIRSRLIILDSAMWKWELHFSTNHIYKERYFLRVFIYLIIILQLSQHFTVHKDAHERHKAINEKRSQRTDDETSNGIFKINSKIKLMNILSHFIFYISQQASKRVTNPCRYIQMITVLMKSIAVLPKQHHLLLTKIIIRRKKLSALCITFH